MTTLETGGLTATRAGAAVAWHRPLVALSDALDRASTAVSVVATITFALIVLLGVFFRYALIVHWGVLFCTNMGLGCIVPPVALNLLISTQLAGVRYEAAVRATIPFIVIMIADLAITAVFPAIPLMLPHLLFGYPLPK